MQSSSHRRLHAVPVPRTPPAKATEGDLLVLVMGPHVYTRTATEPGEEWVDASLIAAGVPPAGWTKTQ